MNWKNRRGKPAKKPYVRPALIKPPVVEPRGKLTMEESRAQRAKAAKAAASTPKPTPKPKPVETEPAPALLSFNELLDQRGIATPLKGDLLAIAEEFSIDISEARDNSARIAILGDHEYPADDDD